MNRNSSNAFVKKENIDADHRRKTLEAIHDSAVDSIITIDESGIIESINPATEVLFGYSSNELVGQNISMLMPNPYHEHHQHYLDKYLNKGMRHIIGIGREIVAQKKDGTVFPIYLAVSEVQLDDRRVFAGFVRDLTDLKLIQEQQTTLGAIIEDSLNEVYIFDAQTLKFILVNRGARENLGYTLEELQQITPWYIKPEFTFESFQDLIQPLLRGESKKIDFSTIHLRKDGTQYDVDIHLQMSSYLTKPVFVAIVLDVTEQRRAERLMQQQREHMQADLERLVQTRTAQLRKTQAKLVRIEKFSTLGKVSGGIAHEIRNPLNAVKTSAYFLLNAQNPSPTKIKEHLERIDRQVTVIDNVVTALSDVAKLPEAELRPTAMAPLLKDVTSSMGLPANIKTVFDFPESLPDVIADGNQIVIAFRNLIRNALDAMPDGGRLTIRAKVRDETVEFAVIDDGIGISEQILENILEPLFTTKARGMGLGLSITLAIVEKNQGSLSIESSIGSGSQFSVSLKRPS